MADGLSFDNLRADQLRGDDELIGVRQTDEGFNLKVDQLRALIQAGGLDVSSLTEAQQTALADLKFVVGEDGRLRALEGGDLESSVRTIAQGIAETVAVGEAGADGYSPVLGLVRVSATEEDATGAFFAFKIVGYVQSSGIDAGFGGTYSATETYGRGAFVISGSDVYMSLEDANTGNALTSTSHWVRLTAQGLSEAEILALVSPAARVEGQATGTFDDARIPPEITRDDEVEDFALVANSATQVPDAKLPDIDTAKLADDAVTTAKIADGAVTRAKLEGAQQLLAPFNSTRSDQSRSVGASASNHGVASGAAGRFAPVAGQGGQMRATVSVALRSSTGSLPPSRSGIGVSHATVDVEISCLGQTATGSVAYTGRSGRPSVNAPLGTIVVDPVLLGADDIVVTMRLTTRSGDPLQSPAFTGPPTITATATLSLFREGTIDERIAQPAREGDTSRWTKDKVPSDTVYDGDALLLPSPASGDAGKVAKVNPAEDGYVLADDEAGTGGGGGLTQAAVDARIAPYARAVPTGQIADAQIPSAIARDTEVAAAAAADWAKETGRTGRAPKAALPSDTAYDADVPTDAEIDTRADARVVAGTIGAARSQATFGDEVDSLVENFALAANSSTQVPDAKIPSGIARDSEVAAAEAADWAKETGRSGTAPLAAIPEITTAKIAADAVTQPKIGPGAVGTTELDDAAATEAKLAANAVSTTRIVDSAVTRSKLAADQQIPALTGQGGKFLAINAGATAVEAVDAPSGGGGGGGGNAFLVRVGRTSRGELLVSVNREGFFRFRAYQLSGTSGTPLIARADSTNLTLRGGTSLGEFRRVSTSPFSGTGLIALSITQVRSASSSVQLGAWAGAFEASAWNVLFAHSRRDAPTVNSSMIVVSVGGGGLDQAAVDARIRALVPSAVDRTVQLASETTVAAGGSGWGSWGDLEDITIAAAEAGALLIYAHMHGQSSISAGNPRGYSEWRLVRTRATVDTVLETNGIYGPRNFTASSISADVWGYLVYKGTVQSGDVIKVQARHWVDTTTDAAGNVVYAANADNTINIFRTGV